MAPLWRRHSVLFSREEAPVPVHEASVGEGVSETEADDSPGVHDQRPSAHSQLDQGRRDNRGG